MKWRTLVLAAALVFLGLGNGVREQSLREAAQDSGMLVDAAVRPAQLAEPAYASTLAREFNMLEPEDALKWEVVHPEPQSYDFSQADQFVDFANRHGMKVRGHTLVWHRQNPKWLTGGKYTSSELTEILEKHIKTVVGHYRGKIFAWDVVNEAFDEAHPGQLRSTIWRDQPGISPASKRNYSDMERCFRWAHEADPLALLFYNEAEAEVMNPKSDAIYAMVRDFRQRGVPIHGVGLQMHIAACTPMPSPFPPTSNGSRLSAFKSTSLRWTLPCRSMPKAKLVSKTCNGRADIYRQIPDVRLSHPGCTAIQTWGFTDKYSWIGSHSKQTQGAALPLDRRYAPKPAYEALRVALARGRVSP